jgi:putative intracellular protease/amidase
MSTRKPLDGMRILILVADEYEDLELWYPKLRLEEAGAHVTLAGPHASKLYRGKNGYPCASDAAIADMEAEDFQGIVCAGGWMPDKIRRDTPRHSRSSEHSPNRESWWRRFVTEDGFRSRPEFTRESR